MAALQQVVGIVTRTNPNGFQLDEQPGTWLNPSKFADPMPELPVVGQRVRCGLDGKGFVRTLELVEPPAPATRTVPPAPTPVRELCITRLACLKAAAQFLADNPEAKSTDVLAVAERWEAWVLR